MSVQEALSRRWHVVLALLLLILFVAPRPWPRSLTDTVEEARFLASQGDHERAQQQYRVALALAPGAESLRLEAAQAALNGGLPAQAIAHLEDQEVSGPRANCIRFQATFHLASPERALDLIPTVPDNCPLPLGQLQAQLEGALAEGDFEIGESLAQIWIRLEPDNPEVWRQLAIIVSVLEPISAVQTLEQARAISPDDTLILDLLAAIETSRTEETPFVHARIGQAFARHDLWREASASFERALRLEPGYVEARAYYGLALDRSGADGLAQLEEAAQAAPWAALPASFLGLHWAEAGEIQRALTHFRKAAALEPENPGFQAQLGAALAQAGDLQAARAAFEESVRLAPRSAEFWRLTARFSLTYGVDVEGLGLPAARRANFLQPNPEHADLLGYAHLLLGDLQEADGFLTRSLAEDPSSPEAHYHYGLLALEKGERAAARNSFLQVLELTPDGGLAEMAERSLDQMSP